MKLISWNIDSLNAALTAESPRALLSRAVIETLVAEDADIIAIQETQILGYLNLVIGVLVVALEVYIKPYNIRELI